MTHPTASAGSSHDRRVSRREFVVAAAASTSFKALGQTAVKKPIDSSEL